MSKPIEHDGSSISGACSSIAIDAKRFRDRLRAEVAEQRDEVLASLSLGIEALLTETGLTGTAKVLHHARDAFERAKSAAAKEGAYP